MLPVPLQTPDPKNGSTPNFVAISDVFLDAVRSNDVRVRNARVQGFDKELVLFSDGTQDRDAVGPTTVRAHVRNGQHEGHETPRTGHEKTSKTGQCLFHSEGGNEKAHTNANTKKKQHRHV